MGRLRCFLGLTRARRCQGTTRTLCVARPDLGQTVHSVRGRLNVRLFRGQKHGVCLGGCNRLFLPCIGQSLRRLNHNISLVGTCAQPSRKGVALNFVCAVNCAVIPRVVARFRTTRNGNNVAFSFRRKAATTLVGRLGRRGVSTTLYSSIRGRPSILFCPITRRSLIITIPGKRPLDGHNSMSLGRLRPCPFVTFSGDDNLHGVVRRLLSRTSIRFGVTYRMRRSGTVTNFMTTNCNITVLPSFCALRCCRLSQVPVTSPFRQHCLFLTLLHRSRMLPIMRQFHGFLLSH